MFHFSEIIGFVRSAIAIGEFLGRFLKKSSSRAPHLEKRNQA